MKYQDRKKKDQNKPQQLSIFGLYKQVLKVDGFSVLLRSSLLQNNSVLKTHT